MASNSSGISSALERLSYGGPSGCIATGQHREVISEAVATREFAANGNYINSANTRQYAGNGDYIVEIAA